MLVGNNIKKIRDMTRVTAWKTRTRFSYIEIDRIDRLEKDREVTRITRGRPEVQSLIFLYSNNSIIVMTS